MLTQLMPAWKPSLSSTSTILASSSTWRCAVLCTVLRYSPTARSSSGIARIMMTPVCELITTRRPSLGVTIISSACSSSAQKSTS